MAKKSKWVLILAVGLVLSACASTPGELRTDEESHVHVPSMDGSLFVTELEMPDGQVVPCVVADFFNAMGLSCDWNGDE